MKKLILFSIAVIMLLGAWVSWPAKYDLKVNLEKGRSQLFEYKSSQVVLVPGQSEADALQQDLRFLCEINSDSVQDNGDVVMRCTFREISLRSQQGRYLYVDYNSSSFKNSGGNTPGALMSVLLHNMLKQSFFVTVSNRGRIQELNGLNEVITKVAAKMNSDPMLEQMLRASLKAKINEELLLAGFENTFCILPQGTVSLGDTWVKENKGRLRQGLNLKNIYTLVSADEKNRNLLHFTVKSEISEQDMNSMGSVSKRQFACSQKGYGTLNSHNGLLNEAELEQSLSSISSETNNKVPVNIKSRVTLKLRVAGNQE